MSFAVARPCRRSPASHFFPIEGISSLLSGRRVEVFLTFALPAHPRARFLFFRQRPVFLTLPYFQPTLCSWGFLPTFCTAGVAIADPTSRTLQRTLTDHWLLTGQYLLDVASPLFYLFRTSFPFPGPKWKPPCVGSGNPLQTHAHRCPLTLLSRCATDASPQMTRYCFVATPFFSPSRLDFLPFFSQYTSDRTLL